MENMKKPSKIIYHNKNINIHQNCLTPFVKPGFQNWFS